MHPNKRAIKYIKQTLTELKEEIDNSTIIVGDFKTPISIMDISCNQKIYKETEDLNNSIKRLDACRILH